jgi:hypothetical protein
MVASGSAGYNGGRFVLYSAESQTWSELGAFPGNWIWSSDSKFLYIGVLRRGRALAPGLYRLSIADKVLNPIGPLTGIDFSRTSPDVFPSITLDDRLVMMSDTSVFQIYFLKWN